MATLTCLREASNNDQFSLVFVHGLGGDDLTTWQNDKNDKTTLWPSWLGEETRSATWTFGYDAALSGWRDSAMPLPDQGNTFIDCLVSEANLKGRPLVLIGHSLGGLVIKTAIVQGSTQGVPRNQALIEQIRGVVFLATPHNGSHLSNLAQTVKLFLRTNEQVGDLRVHNAHLRNLHTQFLAQHRLLGFSVKTYYESRGVLSRKRLLGLMAGPKVMVVNPSSAEPHVPEEVAISLPEDHFSICKPKSRTSQVHKGLVEFINQLPQNAMLKDFQSSDVICKPANSSIENSYGQSYDVFLSYTDLDAAVVENLRERLAEETKLKIWLDKWVIVPGNHWKQAIAKDLSEAKCVAVCIGPHSSIDWFHENIQKSLTRQKLNEKFRVIPVLLPLSDRRLVDKFFELRTWIDFVDGVDVHEVHVLISGIKGIQPGMYPHNQDRLDKIYETTRVKLIRLRELRGAKLVDEDVAKKAQRDLIDQMIRFEER